MKHQNSLIGKIEVQFYDKENNLKKIVKGKNTVTNNGIERICEILTQGLRNGVSVTESIDGIPLNTLTNGQNSIGLNIIEWKDKEYTTFDYNENILGLNQSSVMFGKNHNGNYSYMTKNSEVSDNLTEFYFPKGEKTSGWICDLGLKHKVNELYLFSSKNG